MPLTPATLAFSCPSSPSTLNGCFAAPHPTSTSCASSPLLLPFPFPPSSSCPSLLPPLDPSSSSEVWIPLPRLPGCTAGPSRTTSSLNYGNSSTSCHHHPPPSLPNNFVVLFFILILLLHHNAVAFVLRRQLLQLPLSVAEQAVRQEVRPRISLSPLMFNKPAFLCAQNSSCRSFWFSSVK